MATLDLEDLPTIATIVYFSLYSSMLIGLGYYVHKTEETTSKKSFLKAMWKKKSIYGQILVHLYDTATDIGVLIQWGYMAKSESDGTYDVTSLNMVYLFWISISFLIVYRLASIVIAYKSAKADGQTARGIICDSCLGLIDMYVIKAVYGAIKRNAPEPTLKQKMIQLTESIFESLPQVVLQSVFIIRIQNDSKYGGDSRAIWLVGLSLLASLGSIANKYTWIDKDCVVAEAKEPKWSIKFPYCNGWYLLRVLWRFAFVTTRFAVFSLVWSVLGGGFIIIFIPMSWMFWSFLMFIQIHCIQKTYIGDPSNKCSNLFVYGFVSVVATLAYDSIVFAVGHAVEMLLMLSLITSFAYDLSSRCSMCTKPNERQATDNRYIESFIITGWVALVIDFITYFGMLYFKRFERKQDGVMKMFVKGVKEQVTPNEVTASVLLNQHKNYKKDLQELVDFVMTKKNYRSVAAAGEFDEIKAKLEDLDKRLRAIKTQLTTQTDDAPIELDVIKQDTDKCGDDLEALKDQLYVHKKL
eukprot:272462_1